MTGRTTGSAALGPVTLHRLSGSKKALEACRLAEALYRSGARVVVFLADRGRAAVLDEYLWTFAQNSFVPHALWDGSGAPEEPVVIVSGSLANPNSATVLLIGDRLEAPDSARGWGEIHDFVTGAAEDEGKKAAWEAAGFETREVTGLGPVPGGR